VDLLLADHHQEDQQAVQDHRHQEEGPDHHHQEEDLDHHHQEVDLDHHHREEDLDHHHQEEDLEVLHLGQEALLQGHINVFFVVIVVHSSTRFIKSSFPQYARLSYI